MNRKSVINLAGIFTVMLIIMFIISVCGVLSMMGVIG